MNIRCAPLLLAVVALFGGCQSRQARETDAGAAILGGPYKLKITLDRHSASPGERVLAVIEFENTGREDLRIPGRGALSFGFETKGPFHVSWGSWSSSYTAVKDVIVKPGGKVRYEKAFLAPARYGEVGVYISLVPSVSASLVIQSKDVHPAQVHPPVSTQPETENTSSAAPLAPAGVP